MVASQSLATSRKRHLKRSTHQPVSGYFRLSELPIGETLARRLINEGILFSVLVGVPGSRRGTRLVSAESFDSYVRSLASGKINVTGGRPPGRKEKKRQSEPTKAK